MHEANGVSAQILVVDDSKVNRMLLKRELEEQGHQVFQAEDGAQALDMLRKEDFDLVLLDVEMPVLDGYKTLDTMKGDLDLRHLPVIMVTAIDDMESTIRCIEMGAEDYLPKPFNSVLLKARVGASLDKKRFRDQEQRYLKALERELEIGQDIQLSFLPDRLPQVEGWEISAALKAAREVAGDFYDAFTVGKDESICLVVGDVCDKGVGAALFMTLFRSLLRFTMGATNAFGELSPDEKLRYAVTLTNDYIAETHADTGMFATIFVGLLDAKGGVLTYINAGHEPPSVFRNDGMQEILPSTGLSVGVMPNWEFKVEQVVLHPGDLFFAYTDGAPEMNNPNGEFFGREKLLDLVERNAHSASVVVEKIKAELLDHIGEGEQFDDITLMAVRYS